ncbi:MAG: thioredoxin [Holosporales bacterium]|nr:thioredoxin [Holosporales bacterium]
MLVQTNDDSFQADVLNSGGVVLVDFYATWCGPCRMLLPILETLAEENPDIKIFTVNVDESVNLYSSYDVRNLPTLLIFKNGNVIARNVGAVTKSEVDDLIQFGKNSTE